MLLYNGFEACTINSGEISNWFKITTGLLQGNPLSSSIFILIVEIMGYTIRTNDKIKGIVVNGYEFKMVQFADDTNLFLDFNQNTIQEAIHTLNNF